MSTWQAIQYNEFEQVGKDYASESEVAVYDETHAQFRDFEAEHAHILSTLSLTNKAALIDMGGGTGAFAVRAARQCGRVYGVDVSAAMLARAQTRATASGTTNVEFHHGGLLTYQHNGPPVDAIVSTFVLHHLPDFWKGIALQRLGSMLKPRGQFYLYDVVMSGANPLDDIKNFVERQAALGGAFLRGDAEQHFREEFSTHDWIMDGLLERNGFTIESRRATDGVLMEYVCRISA